ncbi:DUF6586 family protein [Marinomonas fungiae]|uniref:Uncharacterized protein n=1 Tax=Marinomonas fungiae TaxID=1137284 RepID=A0A0K6IK71_9GAMM|nr:DUF6586 family protein [Marinomonas fungiae]CUB03504.1 hypothetical protein Ga0061065_103355 [Marinomonas fungiae]
MSGSSLASITNQRLDAARRLLLQSQDVENDWMSESLESSALFQLRSGLNGLLQEVKTSYSLQGTLDIDALIESCHDKGISVPVLIELSQLKDSGQSWLTQLFTAFSAVLLCQVGQVGNASYSAGTELIGRGTDAGASTKFILNSLTELVLRFREDAAEY